MTSAATPLSILVATSDAEARRPAKFAPLGVGLAVPAPSVGSGLLDRMGGVGPHVTPIDIARPIKEAIARGEPVICWITDEQILLGQLHFDHVIPYSYGGASNAANLWPADALANQSRGNSLEVLYERKIGWKWDPSGSGGRVPDPSQRLVRVTMNEGEFYWSVAKFNAGECAVGAVGSAGLAVAIEGAIQWRRGEFRPDDLGEEAAKAAAGYAAGYSARIAVQSLAPRAMTYGVGVAGVERLASLAGPVAFVASIYAIEAVEQGVALARREVTPEMAAKSFVLAPVGVVKDTAVLAVYGYKFVSPRHRSIRKSQQKWRSINFIPDLKRPDPAEGLAGSSSNAHGLVVVTGDGDRDLYDVVPAPAGPTAA